MTENKGTIRVPTKTPCSYIEMEVEGSAQDMVTAYNELSQACWGQNEVGVTPKEFNAFLDNMLLGEDNHIEQLEPMSSTQKFVVNELKKALKRLKARE